MPRALRATTASPSTRRTAGSDCIELPLEFESLNANATEMDVGHGVKARVASLEDLARLKKTSPDLAGAVRLHALVGSPGVTYEELILPVDADPEPNGRIDRLLEKLANVDVFLTEVNRGERPLRRKKR